MNWSLTASLYLEDDRVVPLSFAYQLSEIEALSQVYLTSTIISLNVSE
jgi:hypothetical protein